MRHGKAAVSAALRSGASLPWEEAGADVLKKLMRLKAPVLQCLSRDPAQRPTVDQLAADMHRIYLSGSANLK